MQISDSANLILIDQDEFARQFYDRLFQDFPEAKRFFDGFDLRAQTSKLVTALCTVQRHHDAGGWVSENYLQGLGKKHRELGVTPEMFPRFIATLLTCLREFHGDDWTSMLEMNWSNGLNSAMEIMRMEYE